MVAHTVLLDFTVSSNVIADIDKRSGLKSLITRVLSDHFNGLHAMTESTIGDSFFVLYTGPRGSLITVRGYAEGLVTVNIEYYKGDNEDALMTFKSARDLETTMQAAATATRSHALAPLKRGGPFERYFPTADERLLEYDIDKLVFEARSPYQKVEIVHSKSLGNLLVLDELQNMSEADLIYTETLMQRGKENYMGKEIVILGGGDGGLLWELLKEKPKYVTMLEIDDIVMKACSEHMRSICGDCLDKKKGENYEGNGASCPESLSMFEEVLAQLSVPVAFTKDRAFVPSFFEDWIFYQVTRK
ncbi:spermine synthase isoform X3 [Fopius arisanus]|uniref:Spermine synthase isoform X3 n=1 Tax=Fopius arisanus TaxID=64838 RepID=A0A9R1TNU0_9HYME|nr:PREDICTED: spermine synthase isoform X3 [Fopius arisanus]